MEEYRRFFKLLVGNEPYPWQLQVAKKIFGVERAGGLLFVRAGTGSGKTEAATLPGLFLGRQVLVVEPYRALIEDMVYRFKGYLSKLSAFTGAPYALGVDYGGRHYIYECKSGTCSEHEKGTKKPFGADVIVTTIDEMVYRVLSLGLPRKASVYASLIRVGKPLVFIDEAHAYSTEAANPLVTLIHLTVSLAMYSTVILASATLPESLESHLAHVAQMNGVGVERVVAMKQSEKTEREKAWIELDLGEPASNTELVERLVKHALKYVERGVGKILVRTVIPEVAYEVYTRLRGAALSRGYAIGVLHGRMPILDRERVFKEVKADMTCRSEKVLLVSTAVIEAGVDLDFDAGVLELTPYRSLEQTMGRVNRKYSRDAWATIVDTLGETWKMLDEEEYLREARSVLEVLSKDALATWSAVSDKLKPLDEKYTADKLSTRNLVDAYGSPYSKMLAVSMYSLFHLEGSFLEHLLALSKTEYETRGKIDLVVEVEQERGNYLRVPYYVAEKIREKHGIDLAKTKTVPKSLLADHSYIKKDTKVQARGLVL